MELPSLEPEGQDLLLVGTGVGGREAKASPRQLLLSPRSVRFVIQPLM